MNKNQAIRHWICSIALLGSLTLPCAAQGRPAVQNPNTNPINPKPYPYNPYRNYQPPANQGYRNLTFDRSMQLQNSIANYMNNGNRPSTNSIIASSINSPFINQMQSGMLPGGMAMDPWYNPYGGSMMTNPFVLPSASNPFPTMPNPFMPNPMMNNPMMMNPMMNNPFMNPMMNNPMMNNPMMYNPYMNPMAVANPMFMNPMTYNPMMMNPGYNNPLMMQPGVFGQMNNGPGVGMFGQPGIFGRGF